MSTSPAGTSRRRSAWAPDGPTLRDLLADAARASTSACSRGRARRCRSSTRTGARCARCATSSSAARRSRCSSTARERPLHCHHEKLVLVDDRVAYVGGLDLTSLAGDRLDSSDHPPRRGLGWHDACLRLEGPIVADVAEHFRLRWPGAAAGAAAARGPRAASRRSSCEPCRSASTTGCRGASSRSSRAIAARFAPRSGSSISRASSSGRRSSSRSSPTKLREPPRDDFRRRRRSCPRDPNNGRDDTRGQLGVLVDAAQDGGDDGASSRARSIQPGGGNPVYVHAKVGIVDDALAHRRLGEPQRALALQRHRGERRRARPATRPRRAAAALGEHLEQDGRRRSGAGRSTSSGARAAFEAADAVASSGSASRRLAPHACAPRAAERPARRRLSVPPHRSARGRRR